MSSLQAVARTHRGLVRSNNEDAYCLRPEVGVCAVADGMGGHQAGEVASALAIRCVEEVATAVQNRAQPRTVVTRFESAAARAHEACCAYARANPQAANLGTTLTAIWLADAQTIRVLHIGDSAAYRWRAGRLEALTEDHTFVQRMVRAGQLTEDEAAVHPRRNVLERCIGGGPFPFPQDADLLQIEVAAGDRLILATDGLTDMLRDAEIAACCATHADREALADALLAGALAAGGSDNVTLIIADII